jgi:hypothetical protein
MDEQRRLEREALLKRLQELQAGLAHDQRKLWELQKQMESRLPIKEQFRRNLERLQILLKSLRWLLCYRVALVPLRVTAAGRWCRSLSPGWPL